MVCMPLLIEQLLARKFNFFSVFNSSPHSRRQNPDFVYQVPAGKSSFAHSTRLVGKVEIEQSRYFDVSDPEGLKELIRCFVCGSMG